MMTEMEMRSAWLTMELPRLCDPNSSVDDEYQFIAMGANLSEYWPVVAVVRLLDQDAP